MNTTTTNDFGTLERRINGILNAVTGARGTDKEIELLLVATDLLVDAHQVIENMADYLEKEAETVVYWGNRVPGVERQGGNSVRVPCPGQFKEFDVDFAERWNGVRETYTNQFDRLRILLNDYKRERDLALRAVRKGRTGISLAGLAVLGLTVPDREYMGQKITANDIGGEISSVTLERPNEGYQNRGTRVRFASGLKTMRAMNVKGVRLGRALAERTFEEMARNARERANGPNRTYRTQDELWPKYGTEFRFRRVFERFARTFPMETAVRLFTERGQGTMDVHALKNWTWKQAITFRNRLANLPQFIDGRTGDVLRTWANTYCPGAFEGRMECPVSEPVIVGYLVPPEFEGEPDALIFGQSVMYQEETRTRLSRGETWFRKVEGLTERIPVIRWETVYANQHYQGEPFLFCFGRTSKAIQNVLGQEQIHSGSQNAGPAIIGRFAERVTRSMQQKATAERVRKERGSALLTILRYVPTVRVLDSTNTGNCLGGTMSWCQSIGLNPPAGLVGELLRSWTVTGREFVRAVVKAGDRAWGYQSERVIRALVERVELERKERAVRAELERAELTGQELELADIALTAGRTNGGAL